MRYALGEFGGASLELGGKRFYPIQVAEKQICWLKATVRGPGGHGAMVNRGGTVARLGRLLSDLDRKRLPVHVTPVVREFVERIAAELPRKEALVLRSLLKPRFTDTALRLLGRARRGARADVPQHRQRHHRPRRREDQRRPEHDRGRAGRARAARLRRPTS